VMKIVVEINEKKSLLLPKWDKKILTLNLGRAIWHIHIKRKGHMMTTCVDFSWALLQMGPFHKEIFGDL
jgi:hypothetical protein